MRRGVGWEEGVGATEGPYLASCIDSCVNHDSRSGGGDGGGEGRGVQE